MRPQRFSTWYQTMAGVLWVYAETFVLIIRMSDGKCGRFTYEQLGFKEIKHDSPTPASQS